MAYYLSFNVFIISWGFYFVSAGNGRHFVTESCGQVLGPDFGTYLEFDRDSTYKNGEASIPESVKGTEFECIIVIRGMPPTTEKRYMSLYWRSFHIKEKELTTIENDINACGKAYVTIFKGKDTRVPEKVTLCGASALPSHYQWEGEYATLYFYIDFRNPALSTSSPVSTVVPTGNKTTTITPKNPVDTFPYPEAYIRLDITSFDYECNDSIAGVVMRCNDSKRCIDDSLRCDFWYSRNCQSEVYPRDNTDTSKFSPGSCYRKTTPATESTTAEPPTPPPNYIPYYAAGGSLLFLLLLFWCCWRPGYLIWRLGRLRNIPCFQACGRCKTCCVFSPCFRRCGSVPCSRCCAEDYGKSLTGGAAWRAAKSRDAAMMASQDSFGLETPPTNGSTRYSFPVRNNSYVRSGTYAGYLPEKVNPNGAPRSSTMMSGFGERKKSLKSKLLPCLSDSSIPASKGGPRKNSIVPFPSGNGTSQRINGPGNTPYPNGRGPKFEQSKPVGGGLDTEDPANLDAVRLANGWLKFLTSDGGHLREHR